MVAGAFEIEGGADNFNLKPKNIADPIPEDQRALQHGVYEVRNIVKLLEERGMFAKDEASAGEFRERLFQVAQVGLAADHVKIRLAAEALDQIRADIVRRKGRIIKYRYLFYLAIWALGGMAVGAAVVIGAKTYPGLSGYGWVIIGSMVGAWLSLAATRREISLEDISSFVDYRFEPFIRMLFVASLAAIVALFLQTDVLSIEVGSIKFSQFAGTGNTALALLLGVITGISEKAVSVRVIESARKVFAPGSTIGKESEAESS